METKKVTVYPYERLDSRTNQKIELHHMATLAWITERGYTPLLEHGKEVGISEVSDKGYCRKRRLMMKS